MGGFASTPYQRSGMPYGLPVLVVCLACMCLLFGCVAPLPWPRPTPSPEPVHLSDLLLDESAFPRGLWDVGRETSLAKDYPVARESLGRGFAVRRSKGYAVASHILVRYRDARLAEDEFDLELRGFLSKSLGMITPWERPAALPYRSPVADRFELACARKRSSSQLSGEFTICSVLARYDEFVSGFRAWVSPDYMTYAELERVLEAIDERMARYVKQSPLPTATPVVSTSAVK